MKSAYLYVRVSTNEHKRKGYSLVKQEDRLIKHCEVIWFLGKKSGSFSTRKGDQAVKLLGRNGIRVNRKSTNNIRPSLYNSENVYHTMELDGCQEFKPDE